MKDEREALRCAALLPLGGCAYEILEVVGAGSNGIVYRARYPDRLQPDCFHQVLLKELFPYTKDRCIRRAQGKQEIVVQPDAQGIFEAHQSSFRLGNRAHLTHLWEDPESSGGNINSFSHNNTLYTVFPFEGGTSLEAFLHSAPRLKLRDTVSMMINLVDALASFHKLRLLHLDVSPDNILLLPLAPEKTEEQRRVLLIDYNCVWMRSEAAFYPAVKQGYSAPELTLRRYEQVDAPTDLFSVCAVFYRILAGHSLSADELQNSRQRQLCLEQSDLLRNQASTVSYKLNALFAKGLRLSPANRYQSAAELRRELAELRDCIDAKGVTHSALWEISKRQCARFAEGMQPPNYLCESFAAHRGERVPLSEFWERVAAGGENVLLLGSGGVGKTSVLFSFWRSQTQSYSPNKPVVWYIPLCRASKAGASGGGFIQRCLLEQVRPDESAQDVQGVARQLNCMMEREGQLVLLLDGLNEVSGARGELLKEIHSLSQKRGVQIVLTERVDTVSAVGFHSFHPWELVPLTPEQVKRTLLEHALLYPDAQELQRLLTNQLLLKLYLEVCGAASLQPQAAPARIATPYDLFREYQNSLWLRAREMFAGDEAELAKIQFVLLHSLPSIAAQMKRTRQRALTKAQLYRVMQQNLKELRNEQFLLTFDDFLGKSKLVLEGISTAEEWFSYAVTTVLVERFKLLVCAQQDYYLFHEGFGDYLWQDAKEHKRALRRQRRKSRVVKTAAAVCASLVLLGCGAGVFVRQSYPFFQRDRVQVNESVNHLGLVLGNTFAILQTEKDLCARADEAVYEGSQQQYDRFASGAEAQLDKVSTYAETYSALAATVYIPQAQGLALRLPDELTAAMFTSAQERFQWVKEHFTALVALLDPARKCSVQDKENALSAYLDSVSAYQSWLNWSVARLAQAYPKSYRTQLLKLLSESPLFESLQGQSEGAVEDGIQKAERELENARKAVVLAGL